MQERGERHIERMAGVSERAVDHIETMNGPEILNSVDEIEKLDKVARRTFALNDNPFPSGFTLNVLNISGTGVQIGDTERQRRGRRVVELREYQRKRTRHSARLNRRPQTLRAIVCNQPMQSTGANPAFRRLSHPATAASRHAY